MNKKVLEIEKYLEHALPLSYRGFLIQFQEKGIESIHIFDLDTLLEMNEVFETKKYAPGYIAIGSDCGDMVYVIKLDNQDPSVFLVGQGSMTPDQMKPVCPSFSEWLSSQFYE